MYNKKVKKENFLNRLWISISTIIGLLIFLGLSWVFLNFLSIDPVLNIQEFQLIFINKSLAEILMIDWIPIYIEIKHILLLFIVLSSFVSLFFLMKNPYIYEMDDEYGSSRFATKKDIKKFSPSIIDKKGMALGVIDKELLRMNQTLSGLVVAPAGSGKSVSVIIPNILSCIEDSLVINDPKGELYEETYEVRKLFGNVYRFEWDSPNNSNKWNMLDLSNIPPDQAGRERIAKVIADTIIGSDSGGDGKFWEQSAKDLLFSSILFTIYYRELEGISENNIALNSSMPYVYDFLSTLGNNLNPYHIMDLELSEEEATRYTALEGEKKVFMAHAYFSRNNNFPHAIFTYFSGFASQDLKTLANIKASISPKISIFGESSVRETTSSNEFSFSLLRGELINQEIKPITVYFVVPALDQEIYGVISALFVDLATRNLGKFKVKKEDKSVRFILDEVAFFPPLQNIINAPAIMRGYRVCYIYACQDFDQIVKKWGKEALSNLLTNTAFKIILGQNNPNTTRMLAEMLGKTTRVKKNQEQKSNNRGGGIGNSLLFDINQAVDDVSFLGIGGKIKQKEGIELFGAEKFGSLKMGEQILLVQNSMNRPVFCKTAYYKNVVEFKKLFKRVKNEK